VSAGISVVADALYNQQADFRDNLPDPPVDLDWPIAGRMD